MQIDDAIESQVRAAFSAVLAQDPAELKAAIEALGPRDLPVAASYATYACGYIALDVLQGEILDDGLAELARDIAEGTKSWADLGGQDTIVSFLRAVATGDLNFPGVPQEDVAGHAFVIGGFLLSHYRPDGKRWFEYLDDIWNAAVARDS